MAKEIEETKEEEKVLFKKEFDKVHPLISERLKQEILNKALNPYFERDDF